MTETENLFRACAKLYRSGAVEHITGDFYAPGSNPRTFAACPVGIVEFAITCGNLPEGAK